MRMVWWCRYVFVRVYMGWERMEDPLRDNHFRWWCRRWMVKGCYFIRPIPSSGFLFASQCSSGVIIVNRPFLPFLSTTSRPSTYFLCLCLSTALPLSSLHVLMVRVLASAWSDPHHPFVLLCCGPHVPPPTSLCSYLSMLSAKAPCCFRHFPFVPLLAPVPSCAVLFSPSWSIPLVPPPACSRCPRLASISLCTSSSCVLVFLLPSIMS